jgi:hypothetical protein
MGASQDRLSNFLFVLDGRLELSFQIRTVHTAHDLPQLCKMDDDEHLCCWLPDHSTTSAASLAYFQRLRLD